MADDPQDAPPETVPPAPPPARAEYVTLSPIISGDVVVQSGRLVSLTEAQATEFATLIRPATAADRAIAGGTWPVITL